MQGEKQGFLVVNALPLFPNSLNADIEPVFRQYCEDIPQEQISELKNKVTYHLELVRAELQPNEFIDIDLAEQIAQRIFQLLDQYATCPENKRRLIVGTARYFIQKQDVQADLTSIIGFDDDAAVLNYVLTELGKQDLKVSL